MGGALFRDKGRTSLSISLDNEESVCLLEKVRWVRVSMRYELNLSCRLWFKFLKFLLEFLFIRNDVREWRGDSDRFTSILNLCIIFVRKIIRK